MTTFANSVGRLAPRTHSHLCVRSMPKASQYKLKNIPEWVNRRSITPCLPISITIGDDDGSQNHLSNQEIAFNSHNPILDHRDRGKRLRLPSYPQIENASHKLLAALVHRARGVSDVG
jgi:hypothetical protein